MSESVLNILKELGTQSYQVLNLNSAQKKYLSLDLSITNKALESVNLSSSHSFELYIKKTLADHEAGVGYGGYLEHRALYKRSDYFNQENPDTERNIHLGIDLWCEAGTEVIAVLDGEIHSFKNNTNFGDYGPTIVLKHQVHGVIFYSLYGHLSLESITGIKTGDRVKGGACIGTLGKAEVNGDYPPHLHFQLILDIENNFGDYPGVCSKNTLEFYKVNCPNPELLLQLKTTKNE